MWSLNSNVCNLGTKEKTKSVTSWLKRISKDGYQKKLCCSMSGGCKWLRLLLSEHNVNTQVDKNVCTPLCSLCFKSFRLTATFSLPASPSQMKPSRRHGCSKPTNNNLSYLPSPTPGIPATSPCLLWDRDHIAYQSGAFPPATIDSREVGAAPISFPPPQPVFFHIFNWDLFVASVRLVTERSVKFPPKV